MRKRLLPRVLVTAAALFLFVPLLPLNFELLSFHDLSVDAAFLMAMPRVAALRTTDGIRISGYTGGEPGGVPYATLAPHCLLR
jgi:hypothetical protein